MDGGVYLPAGLCESDTQSILCCAIKVYQLLQSDEALALRHIVLPVVQSLYLIVLHPSLIQHCTHTHTHSLYIAHTHYLCLYSLLFNSQTPVSFNLAFDYGFVLINLLP